MPRHGTCGWRVSFSDANGTASWEDTMEGGWGIVVRRGGGRVLEEDRGGRAKGEEDVLVGVGFEISCPFVRVREVVFAV